MSVLITGVAKHSIADKKGIRQGDVLLSLNGHEIVDLLDYQFYLTERKLAVNLRQKDGTERSFIIRKEEYDDIGLEFQTYLMDKHRSCKNKCVFCFIDQLPKGMRESLYFKDDDDRLSFLFGNYITLTNTNEQEIQRIITMHISPINISIHTTNPELRVKMMANPHAGEVLHYVKLLADAGIALNFQLVLCPGINDGQELERTLQDLSVYFPSAQSIACVPLGITKYRDGLCPLSPYTKQRAVDTIKIIERYGDQFIEQFGSRLVFASDEFYIKAHLSIPSYDFYEDFDQIENGVGMIRMLNQEFEESLEEMEEQSEEERTVSIATGVDAAPFIQKLVEDLQQKKPTLHCIVYPIINEFFGDTITVTGLLTATDLMKQLSGKELGERLLLSSSMLRKERDVFLDDICVADLEKALGVKTVFVESSGSELMDALCNS